MQRPRPLPRPPLRERPHGPWRCTGPALAAGLALWLALLPAGVRAAPEEAAAKAPNALEQAFGPPCDDAAFTPEIPLRPPLDALFRRYMEARCAAAAGRLEQAAEGFRAGLAAPGVAQAVPGLWQLQRLQASALSGHHDDALAALEALLEAPAAPLLIQRARDFVATQALAPAAAPPERRVDYLLVYLEHVEPQPEDYDLLLRLWELAGEQHNAVLRGTLAVLLWRNPKDEDAAKRWAALPGTPGPDSPFPATGADYYGRAVRLFELGLFERLASELESPALPELESDYAKAIGRLYFRALIRGNLLSHAAVQVNTGSVMRRFAFDRRQQLIWAIRVQLKRRLIGPVLKYLEELEQLSPHDDALPTIFLELLKYNQGRHDPVTTRFWLKRIATEFGNTAEASDAYWSVIWDAIERRAYGEARPLLAEAIRASGPFHPVDQARLYYWQGRLRMLQGDGEAGQAAWNEMEQRWPYGYYTAMAEWQRSGAHLSVAQASDDPPPQRETAPQIEALWDVPPFPEALFLFAVGEPDVAGQLLREVVTQRLSPDALEEAGALFAYLHRYYLQLRLVANHHLDALRQGRPDGSTLWRRAFPRPHWEVVQRVADEQQIDPYFVLAIMREESRFFTSAYSRAGAKGLMQIMPSTAKMVARRNGLDYEEDQLHAPELNIPIGMLYLKRVLRRFDGNPFYAAAAYNAGPGNVRRWVRRYGSLPLDEFVERIPFGETQRYVKRVFLSYRTYTALYRNGPSAPHNPVSASAAP